MRTNLCILTVISLLVLVLSSARAQTLIDWTEGPGRLGLGYPVPIPVDTPLPFNGFRSHAGLHARHQDLQLNSAVVDGQVVGHTRRGRDIWAYRLGSPSETTPEGLPKAAVLFAGTVHAREWQSPEAVTGLMELLADHEDDDHWIGHIRDHVTILALPVINVDGFLQTQRYPRSNWLDSDNQLPATAPRDGRMRRKNLRDADEDLHTVDDHLHGVDLNRNNPPRFPGPPRTRLPEDLTYRGPFAQSEPEIQALLAAADLVPGERLRFYADMHSYTQVFFSILTQNTRRNAVQRRLLESISDHHAALPGHRRYIRSPSHLNNGMGLTSEYFADTYQIPSITWEIEPGQGGGGEYGGFRVNGHDGFILPDSQVSRMRENLALSMATSAFHMAGPPHLMRAELYDGETGALISKSAWSRPVGGLRSLAEHHIQGMEPGRSYRLWIAFSKPMRWRNDGHLAPFPGQGPELPKLELGLELNHQPLDVEWGAVKWQANPGLAPDGYHRYRDDALTIDLKLLDNDSNRQLVDQAREQDNTVTLSASTVDLTGHQLDADPATAVDFINGAWEGYESHLPDEPDLGGFDRTLSLPVTNDPQEVPAMVQPGHSAMWFNPERNGEGWVIEVLPDNEAVGYWFTYDEAGNPRWLIASGEVVANRIVFPELLVSQGGLFGPGFNPDDVGLEGFGTATLVFTDCDRGWFEYAVGEHHEMVKLERLSRIQSLGCPESAPRETPEALQSGSWYDPARAGEGFTVQWLEDGRPLVVWFSYDPDGNQYWMLGTGESIAGRMHFPELHTYHGPRFGPDFEAEDLERQVWGQLELTLDCLQGSAQYESVLPEFGAGQFLLDRLTLLAGLECD